MTSLETSLRNIAVLSLLVLVYNGCAGGEEPQATSEPQEQLFNVNDFSGSHILVSYAGAASASDSVTRSKEEALEKAKDLIAKLQVSPSMFEEFARQESDGPSGSRGGDLGSWNKGQMVPEFDAALENLEVGSITPEPVETQFGYHIIRRSEVDRVPHYASDAFVIAFEGPGTDSSITRSAEEARALADSIKEIINADNFEALAVEYNDFADGTIPFPVFAEGGRQIIPGLGDTLKTLAFGEVGGPLNVPVGFAFVRRLEVDKRAGSHILISYQGARNARPDITISKEEALAEARRITELAKNDPDQFAQLAMEHSDGPSGPNGGDLGTWFRGRMVPEFDEAMDDMQPGDITDEPIETEFGYHIIKSRAP